MSDESAAAPPATPTPDADRSLFAERPGLIAFGLAIPLLFDLLLLANWPTLGRIGPHGAPELINWLWIAVASPAFVPLDLAGLVVLKRVVRRPRTAPFSRLERVGVVSTLVIAVQRALAMCVFYIYALFPWGLIAVAGSIGILTLSQIWKNYLGRPPSSWHEDGLQTLLGLLLLPLSCCLSPALLPLTVVFCNLYVVRQIFGGAAFPPQFSLATMFLVTSWLALYVFSWRMALAPEQMPWR